MAKLTSIYNGLHTFIQGKLPTYSRLADAYDVELNNNLALQNGYSLALLDGENTELEFSCDDRMSVERSFILTFTNIYAANRADQTARGDAEVALIEDAMKIWKGLVPITHLGGVQVANAKYLNDGGIEYLGDTQKFITIVSAISAEYFE